MTTSTPAPIPTRSQRGDNVIRLIAGQFKNGDIISLDDIFYTGDLDPQLIRHFGPGWPYTPDRAHDENSFRVSQKPFRDNLGHARHEYAGACSQKPKMALVGNPWELVRSRTA